MAQSHDEDHLKILSVFHYVVGGLGFLFSLFPTIHLVLGILMVTGVLDDGSQDEVIHTMGWLVAGIAATLITLGFTYSTCLVLAGRYLAARTHYTFCMVMAAISCIFMPFGTILGVFTIIILMKDSVKEQFSGAAGTPPSVESPA